MDFLRDNWAVVLPIIGAAIAAFWPQLKPHIDPIINPNPKPDPGPSPVDPNGPIVIPNRPGLTLALQLAMQLLAQMREQKNPEGEKAAAMAAHAIIDQADEAAK